MCRFCSQKGRVALARAWGVEDRRLQLWAALTAPDLRALHRAEDISSALKGGVNVCQRQLVNEVLGPLVAEFVRNFGREGATPIQRGSNAGVLGRVQAVKLIRHNALRLQTSCAPASQSRPSARWSFGRDSATPVQPGSNAGVLGRVQAVKLI